ncbi:MAG: ABC transporter ATP-binding protein [Pseudomonadota bacterium]
MSGADAKDGKAAGAAIEFRNVVKRFLRTDQREESFLAVDRLSFEVAPGEMVAVLGRTGCGKSTMFNLLTGLIEPTEGTVRVLGHDPFREFNWFRGKMAVVFQNDRLMPWRTAVENVELGIELAGMDAEERRKIALGWLDRLGLKGHEHDYPPALSGGMRQRVSLARAFAVNPVILLCDEPFSALDELTGQRLREEYTQLVEENGKTSIFVTHSINEALQLGERILVFHRPAQIALEAKVAGGDRDAIRARVLAAMNLREAEAEAEEKAL